jgi:hypothetical protein
MAYGTVRRIMTDAEIRAILREAYARLERTALANSSATGQHTREIILKSLKQLQSRLDTDPHYVNELIQASRLQMSGSADS